MSEGSSSMRSPTSAAHDAFQVMFQAADMVASFWQPALKSAGRWQLEMSQLATRQTRASMELAHRLTRCQSPDHVVDAYRAYWFNVGNFYADASRNIATAFVRVAPHAAILQLPLTRPRAHDTMQLLDAPAERKVA